jgi:hypothetical protein
MKVEKYSCFDERTRLLMIQTKKEHNSEISTSALDHQTDPKSITKNTPYNFPKDKKNSDEFNIPLAFR